MVRVREEREATVRNPVCGKRGRKLDRELITFNGDKMWAVHRRKGRHSLTQGQKRELKVLRRNYVLAKLPRMKA